MKLPKIVVSVAALVLIVACEDNPVRPKVTDPGPLGGKSLLASADLDQWKTALSYKCNSSESVKSDQSKQSVLNEKDKEQNNDSTEGETTVLEDLEKPKTLEEIRAILYSSLIADGATSESAVEETSCEALKVGESRIMRRPLLNSWRQYKLSRPSESVYEVDINVSFTPNCSSSDFSNKALANSWMKRANSCLKRYWPHLKGPDGTFVQIRVVSEKSEKMPKPKEITVIEDPRDIRENAGTYSPATDCTVMLHEVLHLTGLVDEYEETPRWQCRLPGPKASIMSDHNYAVAKALINSASILKPAHYRAIVLPSCHKSNSDYNACSKYAYAERSYGQSCHPEDLPKSCINGSLDWINK